MRQYRLQIRATPEELARWEKAAEQETLSLATWARRELERASRRESRAEETARVAMELRELEPLFRKVIGRKKESGQ